MAIEFRLLARAVITCDGSLLVCRLKGLHSFLPGGGVELGEGAKGALGRELREEMGLSAYTVVRFLGVLEDRYRNDRTGQTHHEVNHLFQVAAPGLRAGVAPPSLEPHLEFYWVEATEAALAAANVLPEPVCTMVPAALAAPCPLWVSTME